MKFRTKVLMILVLVMTFSCNEQKTEKAVEVENTEKPIEKSKKLVFDVDLETSSPDDFRFFANNIFLNNSQFMNLSVSHKLNSNETSKKMHFEFPEGVQPDFQIGFALGVKNEKSVKINSIAISYGDLEYSIPSNDLVKYFKWNQFVDYDNETGTLKTKKVDNRLNPIIFLRNPYVEKISNQ
ncbi:hypothetical protein OAS44_01030 [Flavobacteriaceae bacterium]|nr:hypothetical protein [Flavobacteriaceae bacterium]